MILRIKQTPKIHFSCAIQRFFGATAELLADGTPILEAIGAVLLDHFIHAFHAKDLGTFLTVYVTTTDIAATMARSMMPFPYIRFSSLSITTHREIAYTFSATF